MESLPTSAINENYNMSIIDAIYARRSVRHYTNQGVSRKAVEELIGAAIQAPSAMNRQPWAFVVVQDPLLMKRICEEAKELLQKSVEWRNLSEHGKASFAEASFDIFYGATTLITFCAEQEGFQPVGDCYLAAENLMLAATAMGLATCAIGFARDVLKKDEFREALSIPGTHTPVLPIAVGYPAGVTERPPRNPPRILSWIAARA